MAGQRSSRLVACARKCSVKHMVRACSTNQPVLRLSMGSLALITATSWAPGCPLELLGGGWVRGKARKSTEQKGDYKRHPMFWSCRRWVRSDQLGEQIAERWGEDNDVRLHRHKNVIGREHAFNTGLFFYAVLQIWKGPLLPPNCESTIV